MTNPDSTEGELLRRALKALETARDYVNAEYVSRSSLYASYPHRWAVEREDLKHTDDTITAIRTLLGTEGAPGETGDTSGVIASHGPRQQDGECNRSGG